jgi:hypothetical protein
VYLYVSLRYVRLRLRVCNRDAIRRSVCFADENLEFRGLGVLEKAAQKLSFTEKKLLLKVLRNSVNLNSRNK